MNNVILGKTVKAMYKLSGKTLNCLAEETGLSIDTINNFFYARLQKPSYAGIASLVKSTGYTMADLAGFMEQANSFPEGADITEELAKYMISAENTVPVADSTVRNADNQDRIVEIYKEEIERRDRDILSLKKANLLLMLALIVLAIGAVIIALILKK